MIYWIITALMVGWTLGFCVGMYIASRMADKSQVKYAQLDAQSWINKGVIK